MNIKEITYNIKADLYTPVGVYLKVRSKLAHSFLMESADMMAIKNSKSFVGFEPIASICVQNNACAITYNQTKQVQLLTETPLLDAYQQFYNALQFNRTPHALNGLYGYFNFDAIPYVEKITFNSVVNDNKDIPECYYQLYKYVLVFDHFNDTITVIINALEHEDEQALKSIVQDILTAPIPEQTYFKTTTAIESNFTNTGYKNIVQQGINHCKRGDVFQVVLSRRFSQQFIGDDFQVYRELRCINPSPYLFYFDYSDFHIFGSSPESVLVKNNDAVFVHPIAGTVRRTGDDKADKTLAEKLKVDPKEKSEHIMLVDLARNDLSKLGKVVEVTSFMEAHYYSHLIHLVSEVKATVAHNENALTVLASVFPAGTLSGAPKYRALQIIDDLETEKRSFYGGALGVISFNGDINHAIIIRSFLSKTNTLIMQAGAGVVVSSTPDGECNEVNTKLAALHKAIEVAEQQVPIQENLKVKNNIAKQTQHY
jgi:anthranilate synthase component I